tara:strand:- start:46 stop:288 length:243 start_codon:yes stop_codon:yes gene_type:complete
MKKEQVFCVPGRGGAASHCPSDTPCRWFYLCMERELYIHATPQNVQKFDQFHRLLTFYPDYMDRKIVREPNEQIKISIDR